MKKIIGRLFLMAFAAVALVACQTPPPPMVGSLTQEQIAVLRQEGFKETEDGYNLSGKVLFAVNSTELTPESALIIERLGKILLDVGIDSIVVEGHTDNQGAADYNQALSERRALKVAQRLQQAGFAQEKMLIRGFGMSRPVADNRTEAGRSENRRVAMIVGSTLAPR